MNSFGHVEVRKKWWSRWESNPRPGLADVAVFHPVETINSPIKSNTPPDLTQARNKLLTQDWLLGSAVSFCVAFSATPEYVPGEVSDCERAARISRACGSTGHPFTAKVGTALKRTSGCGSSGFQRIHTLRACLSYPLGYVLHYTYPTGLSTQGIESFLSRRKCL